MLGLIFTTLVGFLATHSHAWRLTYTQAGTESNLESVSIYSNDQHAAILKSPADWSRDVYPVNVHSHNDHWRDVPLFDALSLGVRSIECDLHYNPIDDKLYVGHDPFSLSRKRTFEDLYLNPLKTVIDQANQINHVQRFAAGRYASQANLFAELQRHEVPTVNGTFPPFVGYFSAGLLGLNAPIQLYLDVKTNYSQAFPKIIQTLQPMADAGYFWRIDTTTNTTVPSAVKILMGGVTKVDDILALPSPRFVWWECPLGQLDVPHSFKGQDLAYDPSFCGWASDALKNITTWKGITDITDEQRANLTRVIQQAHARNIPTRVYEVTTWPVYARNAVNKELLALGSDWINADYLEDVVKNF